MIAFRSASRENPHCRLYSTLILRFGKTVFTINNFHYIQMRSLFKPIFFIILVVIVASTVGLYVASGNRTTQDVIAANRTTVENRNSVNFKEDPPVEAKRVEIKDLIRKEVVSASSVQNNLTILQNAKFENNPIEIYRGILARRECRGLESSDLSTLIVDTESMITPSDKNKKRRIDAASNAQKICAGFVHNKTADADEQILWDKLKEINAPEYVAKLLNEEVLKGKPSEITKLRDQACDIIVSAKRNPNALMEFSNGLTFLAKKPAHLANSAGATSVGVTIAACRLAGQCPGSTVTSLLLCAYSGDCDGGSFSLLRGSLTDNEWRFANETSDSIILAANTKNCNNILRDN